MGYRYSVYLGRQASPKSKTDRLASHDPQYGIIQALYQVKIVQQEHIGNVSQRRQCGVIFMDQRRTGKIGTRSDQRALQLPHDG